MRRIARSLICYCPLLNDISFKVFVGLVRLTSNHMFRSGDFWDKSCSYFLKILKLPSFKSRNVNIFKNALGQFIPNCPTKHVGFSTIKREIHEKGTLSRNVSNWFNKTSAVSVIHI